MIKRGASDGIPENSSNSYPIHCGLSDYKFIHELGHALAALILTKEEVTILLGAYKENPKTIGHRRLKIAFRKPDPFVGFVSVVETNLTKSQRVMFYLGGPIISLVLGIISIFVSINVNNGFINVKDIFEFWAILQLIQFFVTAIPMVYPSWWSAYGGHASDGMKVLRLMRSDK